MKSALYSLIRDETDELRLVPKRHLSICTIVMKLAAFDMSSPSKKTLDYY